MRPRNGRRIPFQLIAQLAIMACDGTPSSGSQAGASGHGTTNGGTLFFSSTEQGHTGGTGLLASSASGGAQGNASTAAGGSTDGVGGMSAVPTKPTASDVRWMNSACDSTSDAGDAPCNECILTQCNEYLDVMFGAGWKASTSTGVCADYIACVRACSCGDKDCYQLCLDTNAANNADCVSAIQSLGECATTTCKSDCAKSGY